MQIVDILELLVPDVWTSITQLCATAVLFFLMYKLAWKPVKKILDERSAFEQKKLTEARELQEENEKIKQQAKDIISEANRSAEAIDNYAREEALIARNELIQDGKKEAEQLLENAKREAKLQQDKLMEDMRSQIVDSAIMAAEKILENNIDSESEKHSVDSFVREVINK